MFSVWASHLSFYAIALFLGFFFAFVFPSMISLTNKGRTFSSLLRITNLNIYRLPITITRFACNCCSLFGRSWLRRQFAVLSFSADRCLLLLLPRRPFLIFWRPSTRIGGSILLALPHGPRLCKNGIRIRPARSSMATCNKQMQQSF